MWMLTLSDNIRYYTEITGSYICFVVKCVCLVTEDTAAEEEQSEEDVAGW